MLETIDLSRSLSKDEYRAIVDPLTIRLGELQRSLRSAKVPTLLVFEGWDAAGKGTVMGALMQPLDPRGFRVFADKPPTEEERLRPFLWRFWQRMPRAGEISIFDRSWYTLVLRDRVEKLIPKRVWRGAYGQINEFESTLVDGGLTLLKFYLHIGKKEQRRRFEKLEKDAAESWKVSRDDWRQHKRYEDYAVAVEEMVARTSTAHAPWTVVEAHDRRFAVAKVFETVAAAWEEAASRPPAEKPRPAEPVQSKTRLPAVLTMVDLKKRPAAGEYERDLEPLQRRLRALEHLIYEARIPVTIVCEGWDAAGKGGAVRRLTSKLDPRGFEVIGISAPNDEERAHHYLWRFWRHIPKAGHLVLFDRSWYGRVLVERVEGFCHENEWRRAYREINEFESQLTEAGGVVLKLWFQIDKDTQLERFRERERVGYKKWKITGEDWRNRERWPLYEDAVAEMLERTSTTYAPWRVIPANDKYYARLAVLREVTSAIERALERHGVSLPALHAGHVVRRPKPAPHPAKARPTRRARAEAAQRAAAGETPEREKPALKRPAKKRARSRKAEAAAPKKARKKR